MVRSTVNQHLVGTPEYVVMHGLFQVYRGRRPSMHFREFRNPRKAFMAAIATVNVRKILNFDAFATAGKVIGPGTPDTENLGLHLLITSNAMKNDLLRRSDDTSIVNELGNYMRILKEEGFELVLETPFVGKSWSEETPPMERHYVFFHRQDGVLLSFDTFGGNRVCAGHFYYNWSPNDIRTAHHCTSSGSWVKYLELWCGSHDCRVGLRLNLNNLRSNGKFVTPWVKADSLWLLHHMDVEKKDYDDKAINAERIARLPEYVQQAIAGK